MSPLPRVFVRWPLAKDDRARPHYTLYYTLYTLLYIIYTTIHYTLGIKHWHWTLHHCSSLAYSPLHYSVLDCKCTIHIPFLTVALLKSLSDRWAPEQCVQSTVCSVQFTIHSIQCTKHSVSVQCAVQSVQSSVQSIQCTNHSVQCRVCSEQLQCTVYSVPNTVCSAQCTVHSIQCTV